MDLKNVLKACDDALKIKDFDIRTLQEENKKLKDQIKELTSKSREEYGEG